MIHTLTYAPPGNTTVTAVLKHCPAFDGELIELIGDSWEEKGGTQEELVEFLWTNCVIDNAGREILHDCIEGALVAEEVASNIRMLSLDRLFESLQMIDVEATANQLTEEVGADVEFVWTDNDDASDESMEPSPKQQDHWNQYNHGEFISFSTDESSLSNVFMMPDPILRRRGDLTEPSGALSGSKQDLSRYCRGRSRHGDQDPCPSNGEIFDAAAALLRELQAC